MARLEIHSFPGSAALARSLAEHLKGSVHPVEIHHFPDGESRVRVDSSSAETAVVVCSLDDPNAKLVEVLLAADALRRRAVGQVALVAPYLGYMRQDRAFREGEAVSQQAVGTVLGHAFDQVLTVEAHLHRITHLSEVIPCRAASISAAPAVATWLRDQGEAGAVVGPDAESAPWVRAIGESAKLDTLVCRKQRRGDRDVVVRVPCRRSSGEHVAWIVDDIASSGATLEATARALRGVGFQRVNAIVVHALFERGTEVRLRRAGIETLVSTDSIAHPTNAITIVPLLARALAPDPAAAGGL
jgi:ribose-phosphate pyrophosphokinase